MVVVVVVVIMGMVVVGDALRGGMGVGGSGVVFSTLGLAARKYYGVVLDRAGRPRE